MIYSCVALQWINTEHFQEILEKGLFFDFRTLPMTLGTNCTTDKQNLVSIQLLRSLKLNSAYCTGEPQQPAHLLQAEDQALSRLCGGHSPSPSDGSWWTRGRGNI